MEVTFNQIYYSIDGKDLLFDFFRPSNEKITPLVVFFHGGGWVSGDKSMYHDEAMWLAKRGYSCACVGYRLAPQYQYPAAVADSQRFVQFARANAEKLHIDPNKIIAFGNSAGGYLSSLLGLCTRYYGQDKDPNLDHFFPQANGVVSICGVGDLTRPEAKHLPISWAFLEQFMPCPYSGHEKLWEEASPLYQIKDQKIPFLIIHGDQDDLVPIALSQHFYETLKKADVPCEFHALPGEGHSFTWKAWEKIRMLYLHFFEKLT